MDILVVDDSKAMRGIVTRAVKAAGYGDATFREAGNGAEALEAIRARVPDLVLSDWNMPQMSGFELVEAIRAEGHQLRIGLVTSEADPGLHAKARAAGARFVLCKPFTPDAVKAALSSLS